MDLIDTVARLRQDKAEKERPIIFVCHSLGGIVVKQALIHATLRSELYGAIVRNTIGLMFFGTPQGGGNRAAAAEKVSSIMSVFTGEPRNSLLSTLKKGSLYNEATSDDFNPQLGAFKVVSFFEEKKTSWKVKRFAILPQVISMIVVDRHSAKLGSPGEVVLGMDADHNNICKFSGDEDDLSKLEKVIYHLSRIASTLSLPKPTTGHRTNPDLPRKIIEHFQSLSSMSVEQHLYEVQTAQGNTFQWIKDNVAFQITEKSTMPIIFHITGKPGSGKTVLSKLMYRILSVAQNDCYILFFAFNDRDSGRRSPIHLMASLVAQTLARIELPGAVLDSIIGSDGKFNTKVWNEREFKKTLFLFEIILQALPVSKKFVILVDALDECVANEERRSMLHTFGKIASMHQDRLPRVNFVFTSRPYSNIDFGVTRTFVLDLNSEDSMDHDLEAYIVDSVGFLIAERPGLARYEEKILSKLRDRAEKMYLLIELLLDMIRRHHDSSPGSIEGLLKKLPENLSAIYMKLWSEIPEEHKGRAKLIFSWVLCSFRPLTVKELGLGLAKFDITEVKQAIYRRTSAWQEDNPLDETSCLDYYLPMDLEGDLARLFGPLVHIEGASETLSNITDGYSSCRVKLCHQTVKDHFINEPGFIHAGETHLQMAKLCARIYDGTIEGDPDTKSGYDIDDMTIVGVSWSESNPYSHFWENHKEAALDFGIIEARKIRLRRKVVKRYAQSLRLGRLRIRDSDEEDTGSDDEGSTHRFYSLRYCSSDDE
ncbi:uncharacterized protein N0V89_006216 [Didymosphaeria variabile]|uniref:Nephrocystin 3-like N-terminal domain-containing protein n=1 Tax=Didymosphaeria variabile TaxID=1932322 RepID=A0A9W8XN61_9PLEO|nr:uncharacterized protein N0V89_006216 [Didymosphaeria variabile]KAJ4354479.1 hypothetical protein N0V89_006216 [Didymosphaeria variabile]